MNDVCSKDGCDESGSCSFYKGKPLCVKHYDQALDSCLQELYSAWEPDRNPSFKFKQMLGRISQDQEWECNESYLSQSRIRDRAYAFEKTDNGCTFKITRHPGAHKYGVLVKITVQTWEADLTMKKLNLLGERDWKESDPDPGFES